MMKTGRLLNVLLLFLLLICPLLGQTSLQQQTQPPVPPTKTEVPGLGVQVESQEPTPPPDEQSPNAQVEHKISPAEAQELFRSVDEILSFVSEDTGLPIKHPVKRQLASREQVERYVEDRMKDDEDTKRFERSEIVMKKLRLLPANFNLREFLVRLLKEQVAGYYDAKTKTVYLLDWVEPEAQKPVLAHELTHALQDQNFDLQKWTKAARGKDDDFESDERIAARQAVTEGQGMVVLVDYMLRSTGQTIRTSPMLADAISRSMISNANTPMLSQAPQYIRDVLLFPYQYGVSFERDLLVKDGIQGAFAGAMRSPPQDTHEVMQPQAYLSGQHVSPLRPIDLSKVVGKKFSKYDVGIMGEFDIESLLDQFAGAGAAQAVSPNWRGGYYYAFMPEKVRPGTMPTLVYISRWSSPDAASQFAAAYSKAVWKRYRQTEIVKGEQAKLGDDGKVHYPERLSEPVTWKTEEGPVIIEPSGDMVLVSEGFDEATTAKIRDSVFSHRSHSAAQ